MAANEPTEQMTIIQQGICAVVFFAALLYVLGYLRRIGATDDAREPPAEDDSTREPGGIGCPPPPVRTAISQQPVRKPKKHQRTSRRRCLVCKGKKRIKVPKDCHRCRGRGFTDRRDTHRGFRQGEVIPCRLCRGRGRLHDWVRCSSCESGTVRRK